VRTSSNPSAEEKQELERWDKAEKDKLKAKPRAEMEKPIDDGFNAAEREKSAEPSQRKGGPSAEAETTEESSAARFAYAYLSQIDPADKKAKGTADSNGALYGMNYITVYIDGNYAGQTSCATGYYPGSYMGYGSCSWEFQIPPAYQNGVQHTFVGYYSAPNVGSTQFANTTFTLFSGADPNWNNGNYPTADDPGLRPNYTGGDPPFYIDPIREPINEPISGTDGPGSGSFSFSAPVISLGGRGMDVNLALSYNSLLWHKAGNVISYDIDKGNVAPGWNIGFGKLMDMDTQGGSMIEGADGSRHSYEGTIQTGSPGYSTYYGRTTDGSFIDYESYRTPTGISGGVAHLANGTQIIYGAAANGVAYPTQIKDRQGNLVSISYQNNQGPNINQVVDNLGRAITFNYDGLNRLVSITGPAQNGGSRVYVRLHYTQMTISQSFNGLTPAVRNANPYLIDAIYYPDLNTGYWFGDGDSYSAYGMIAKVSERRAMSWSGANNNDQGTITAGNMSRQMVYNYPLSNANLTEAPKYTQMSEDWADRGATPVATTTYSIDNNSNPRTTTVTLPNGNKIVQYSKNNPNQPDDGLLFKVDSLSPSNQLLSRSETDWQGGDYNSMRVTEIRSTDEKGQMTKQTFTYEQFYNQVATVSEYGYNNALFRKAVSTYENGDNYRGYYNGTRWVGGRHIFSLTKTQELFDANNSRLSKQDYNYDQYPLVNTENVVMYDQTFNPSTTNTVPGPNCVQWDQYWVSTGGWWDEWGWYHEEGYWESYCVQYEQISAYNPATAARGNLTQSITYSDAATPQGAIPYETTYDITGNVRTTTTDCCQQMQFYYSTATQYSQPEVHKKGSPSDPNLQNIESATYDFNTGLLKTATNFNGRTTSYGYDDALRPTGTFYPTGATTQIWYHPAFNIVNELIWQNGSYTHVENWFNGRGQQTLRSEYNKKTNNYWDQDNFTDTNITYDVMGRKATVSVPHQKNLPTAGYTTYQYDALSRVTQVQAPDGSISQTFYNQANSKPSSANTDVGNTVRSRDAWGRERWARTDDFGRLVEVVEPDPNGNGDVLAAGNLQTQYTYNTKDELIQVNQGGQVRMFWYDSLGRLVRQKLAEQNGSLTYNGQFVGGDNGGWSDVFVYDNRSNLIQRTDARGVKTNFVYNNDPLNRLQGVTYDKSGADTAHTIHDATPINLSYMSAGDKTRVSQAQTWNTLETNSYDVEGRISEYTLNLVSGQPLTTSYLYDSLNRLTEVRYPAQYGVAGNPRKVVTPTYDETSRLKELKVDNQIQMSEIVYNPLSQVTQLKTGAATGNADVEQYSYDAQTGLLTNQKVIKQNNNQSLLDLSYDYQRGGSNGTVNGKTGQLTKIVDNLNQNKNRVFEFDTLGRLKTAKAGLQAGATGVTANWTQNYSYDRYGNRTNVSKTGVTQDSQAVPLDGLANQTYQTQSNRVNGYIYDLAGNLTRGQAADGSWQRFEYDSAGRQRVVKDDAGNEKLVSVACTSRQRVVSWEPGVSAGLTWYVWGGSSVIAEYSSTGWGTTLSWSKSYIYAGSRLLSTFTKDGGGEKLEFHHPDRLGTRLVTNNQANTSFEQNTLPFGTALAGESTGATNQRFTSYDRSQIAQLDYAVNRSYSSGQGRFTSVDPIGMEAIYQIDPQSTNLYAYTQNNPIDFIDPTGLLRVIDYSSCRTTGYIFRLVGYEPGEEDDIPIYEVIGEIQTCNVIDIEPIVTPEPPTPPIIADPVAPVKKSDGVNNKPASGCAKICGSAAAANAAWIACRFLGGGSDCDGLAEAAARLWAECIACRQKLPIKGNERGIGAEAGIGVGINPAGGGKAKPSMRRKKI
jgi:RHS repeat-associated protein